ncbi:MAG: leucyl-tRNA synthetase, partial [Capsulimonas sp.]|nr:leucyl-tRNA synthetase [Capsulimonas sp.]
SGMVKEYAVNYKRQLNLMGMAYDWDREINSSDPDYYHWTQWIFLQLNKRGLAERKNANINWCPFDKTALANEEVVNGRCQRCNSLVEKKAMPQWYLKITQYAERLIADLDTVDWPEGIKMQQRNWIGRSEGAEVDFQAGEHTITVFTTRPDTLWGATFMVLAPEHPLVATLTTTEQKDEIEAYVARAGRVADIDRQAEGREKTGVFTGAYASNPVNGAQVPVWIADYVLTGYGTGAIMAVPAHDQRDFDFARKFGLPIIPVYQQPGETITGDAMTQATTDQGVLTNSGAFNGLAYSKDTVRQVSAWLEQQGNGKPVVNYRFRDWLLSRQRYWGVPIPIIHCPTHGAVPVPEDQLPVLLPPVEKYEPSGTGESPLATIPEFVNTVCPICGEPARRETDTMAGFACSSWYFLRFADPHNGSAAFSSEAAKYWLPVDMYVGGAEHAVMHLLYARFWTKVLYDEGLLEFNEPFTRLRNQGMMLANTPGRKPVNEEDSAQEGGGEPIEDWVPIKPEDMYKYKPEELVYRWAKMSKSSGNVVTPDETATKYGADSTRLFEMFIAPFEETVQWSEDGIRGSFKFLARVYRLVAQQSEGWTTDWRLRIGDTTDVKEKALRRKTHQTIVKIADDLENFRFNTSVASLMEWVNAMYEVVNALPAGQRSAALDEAIENLILVLAPFAPHLADELWTVGLGQSGFLYKHAWPEADAEVAKADEITLVVQVNGKVRDKITAAAGLDNDALKAIALESERVQEFTNGKTIRNVIVVPGKLVNIVVG